MATLDEVRQSIPPELGTLQRIEEGVLFRRPAYRMEWIAPLLLGLPFPIRIIQPPELRTMMHAIIEKAAALLETDEWTSEPNIELRRELP